MPDPPIRHIAVMAIAVSLLILSTSALADQKQKLPRSYGPLYLGMSLEEFKKILPHADPGRCVHCAEEELQADVCVARETGSRNLCMNVSPDIFQNAHIDHQPGELLANEIICFFYKGILYDILLTNVKARMASVKQHYTAALGKQTGSNKWNTGLSQLRWSNASTVLSITFDTKPASRENVSNFIEIRYTDSRIQRRVPKEKGCREDPKK